MSTCTECHGPPVLNLDAWDDILATYGRTMGVAVALTDPQGRLLGRCHNPQPVWTMVRDVSSGVGVSCPFCIGTASTCTAVSDALQTGASAIARDQAGLTHVAVPLSLGDQHFGAIIAGQVFDRYPDPMTLRRVAKDYGLSSDALWAVARRQIPIGATALRASGDLLCGLGHAFLRQRYGALLETKLAETNGRFRLLVEGIRDYALFTIDAAGLIADWNVGAERLLGYGEAEILHRNFACLFPDEDIQQHRHMQQLRVALQTGRSEDEGRRVRKDGTQFQARVTMAPLPNDAGPVRGFALIMEDVTQRTQAAIMVEEARQQRIRLQETFLSHVSHELRTPLTASYFFTTNVLDGIFGDLTPPQHEHLTLALDNLNQLKEMVDDLLDIARVGSQKLTVEPQCVNGATLVAEVLSTCRTNAALKRITLREDIAPGLPFMWADPARVRQILINLIDNGIKFTADEGVVTVACRSAADDPDCIRLSVMDTGCGIAPENREIIFDRLAQVKGGAEASRSGLGLGLFISKELVVRQGGRIWVTSTVGQGSTFSFTLPVFSLRKLCARVFAAPNRAGGALTVIAIDVRVGEPAQRAALMSALRRLLARCIHPDRDVLLPIMSDASATETLFIVAATDTAGFEVMATRIARELRIFDTASTLTPNVTSTTLCVPRGSATDEQLAEITQHIERFVHRHLLETERPL